jgi:para-nitrobenzyl esterase
VPTAKGLFQRAIVMSGAGIRMAEHKRATKLAEAVFAELGLKANQVDQLQALPFERLLAAIDSAQKKLPPPGFQVVDRYGFGPVVDGRDLPHHPFDPTATDVSDDVPVMVGGTKDENAIFSSCSRPRRVIPCDQAPGRQFLSRRDRFRRRFGGGH